MLRFLKLFWYLSGSFLFVSLLVNFDFSPEPAPKRGYVVCFQNVAAIQIQLISFKTSISLHLFSLNLSLSLISLFSLQSLPLALNLSSLALLPEFLSRAVSSSPVFLSPRFSGVASPPGIAAALRRPHSFFLPFPSCCWVPVFIYVLCVYICVRETVAACIISVCMCIRVWLLCVCVYSACLCGCLWGCAFVGVNRVCAYTVLRGCVGPCWPSDDYMAM